VPEFLGSWEFIVLALLVLVLFGAKRLPDSARALGRSMRIFKAETKGLRDDDKAAPAPAPAEPQALPTALPPAAPAAPLAQDEHQRPLQQ
jgi:sec-independent protein translocase protein TatA